MAAAPFFFQILLKGWKGAPSAFASRTIVVEAIANDLEEARDIVETLSQNGFSSEDIGLLTGTEDAKKLEAAIGKKGFIAKLLTSGVEMGDRDTEYIKTYRRALLNGRTVVGVMAENDETRKLAAKVLKAEGARFITFSDDL